MSRNSRQPRPSGWIIQSVTVARRDAPRRLEQAFQLLLDADPGIDRLSSTKPGELNHASRRLCQSLDPEAGA